MNVNSYMYIYPILHMNMHIFIFPFPLQCPPRSLASDVILIWLAGEANHSPDACRSGFATAFLMCMLSILLFTGQQEVVIVTTHHKEAAMS